MGLANIVDIFMGAINKMARGDLSAYSILETGHGKILLCADGSAATLIKYNGTVSLGGKEDLLEMARSAAVSLAPFFSRPGHALQVYYYRDPDRSRAILERATMGSRNVAKNLGMTLDDVFDEEVDHLSKFIADEAVYFVLWTRPGILPKAELKKLDAARQPPPWWPKATDTQQLHTVTERVMAFHRAYVQTFMTQMRSLKMSVEAIDAEESVRAIRDSIYIGSGHERWRPYMPGMVGKAADGSPKLPPKRMPEAEKDEEDFGYLLWPSLNAQIFDKPALIQGDKIEIADKIFAPIDLTFGQQNQTWFNDLIDRVREIEDQPWRVSFLIEGDGLGGMGLMPVLASIVGITAKTNNKLFTDAHKALSFYKESEGAVVRMRISFATWGPRSDVDLIDARANKLQRSIEAWGFTQTSTSMGDPVDGMMSSALALNVSSTATAGFPPLEDAIYMLPLMREASPFSDGEFILRTRDGRLWPVQIASPQHNSFVSLVYGPSGFGKSVFLNTRNLAFCLSPRATSGAGGTQVPLLGIIEIGESSKGLISLLQEALPAAQRHLVIFHRLRMLAKDAINPFDTQLGLRKPLVMERIFLVNLLSTLLTPVSEKPEVPVNIPELSGQIVDIIYEKFSDRSGNRSRPRMYTPNEEAQVDEAIQKFGIPIPKNMTWWYLVDAFFEKGAIHEATLAQRHAVPRLEDLTSVRGDEKLMIWQEAKMPATQESVLSFFDRMVNNAMTEYPIFTQPTRVDFGSAKVISIDLSEVAKGGSPASEKMSAITYMLARYVIARTYQLHSDDLIDVPELYKVYYKDLARRIMEQPKRLVMDEFHRTASAPAVRQQAIVDMREGRKYNMQIELASQLLRDFDTEMVQLASEYWILGRMTMDDARQAKRIFELSNEAVNVIWNVLKGPTSEGAPMLAVMQLKSDRHEHLLYNTLGPQKAWAFSTTAEDRTLRTIMYDRVGPVEARKRLGKRFPGGSANAEIQRRIKQASTQTSSAFDDEAEKGVISLFAEELIRGT
jgi:intracellular multiplication protein IcmB